MRFFLILFILLHPILYGQIGKIPMQSKAFYPGKKWVDQNGININAHGGGVMFYNNLYYWYGQHMIEGKIGNTAQVGVHLYSSSNLYNWKDEGIVFKVNHDKGSEIEKGCIIERPKVVYNKLTNTFVMWFHLELINQGYEAARTGVAISNSPYGPFKYIKSIRPNAGIWPLNANDFHKKPLKSSLKRRYCGGLGCLPEHVDSLNILGRDFKTGQMSRDMTIFVDDDNKAYQIYSSEENSTLHISQLSEDYLSHSGNYMRFFPNRYMEAPTVMKTSTGKYFLIASDCTGWAPNAARSAVADNIFGPWTELKNPCVGINKQTTFNSQGTYILPIQNKYDAFIFMADRWKPNNPIDGDYIWLPIKIIDDKIVKLEWYEEWDLNIYN